MNTGSIALRARLEATGEGTLRLTGRCMDPLLVDGDSVKVIRAADYTRGNLCLFVLPSGDLAVHRLIRTSPKSATLKGDHARRSETVPWENVLGVVGAVKLSGSEEWHAVDTNDISTKIITRISIGLIKKREGKSANPFKAILRTMRIRALVFWANRKRRTWS